MKYSDENLYRQFFRLSHTLWRSRIHGSNRMEFAAVPPPAMQGSLPEIPSTEDFPADEQASAIPRHCIHDCVRCTQRCNNPRYFRQDIPPAGSFANDGHPGTHTHRHGHPHFETFRTPHPDGRDTEEGSGGPQDFRGYGKHSHRQGHFEGQHGFPHRFDDGRRPMLARERILRLIGEEEPVSQIKLASLLSIRPQSLSEQLAKLENDGLILRTKNERDKRMTLVSLSEQGRLRALEVEAFRSKQVSDFLSPLSGEEREQLFMLLEKLLNHS